MATKQKCLGMNLLCMQDRAEAGDELGAGGADGVGLQRGSG